jgi:hypothetical protein
MVTEPFNDPQYWRSRARDARRLAEDMKDGFTRDALREIAQSYEALAQLAERGTIVFSSFQSNDSP